MYNITEGGNRSNSQAPVYSFSDALRNDVELVKICQNS